MSELIEFITARLDEDEAFARAANTDEARRPWGDHKISPVPEFEWGRLVMGYLGGELGRHCARHNPVRVLAQVAALRAVMGEHLTYQIESPYAWCATCVWIDRDGPDWPCPTLRHLAAIWAVTPTTGESGRRNDRQHLREHRRSRPGRRVADMDHL